MSKKVRIHLALKTSLDHLGRRANLKTVDMACSTASQRLYYIISEVANSKALKSVEIVVDTSDFEIPDAPRNTNITAAALLQKALWPLTLLGEPRSVNITGVPPIVEQDIKANLVTTAVSQCNALFTAAERAIGECKKLQDRLSHFGHEYEGFARCTTL